VPKHAALFSSCLCLPLLCHGALFGANRNAWTAAARLAGAANLNKTLTGSGSTRFTSFPTARVMSVAVAAWRMW